MEDQANALGPLLGVFYTAISFGFLALLIWIGHASTARARREAQETIRQLAQTGQTLTPDMVRAITADREAEKKDNDLRGGLKLLAIALALLVLAFLIPPDLGGADAPEVGRLVAGVAAFPGFLGIVRIVLHLARPKSAG